MKKGHLAWPVVLLAVLLASCSRYDLYDWIVEYERDQAGLTQAYVELEGLTIAYLHDDEASPQRTLLMVHGFGGNKDNWTRMAAQLPDDYRLLIPDLPGHGDSSIASPAAYTVEAQAATLVAFLDRLGVERVDMAGNSMGGGIAVYFASRYPERVNSIALFDPAGSDRYPSQLDDALARGENPLVVSESGDLDQLLDFVMEKRPFLPWPLTSVMEEKAMARKSVNEEIFDAILSSGEQLSLEHILPTIKDPTLIVWGRQDRVLAPENARVFAEGIPDTRVELLEGVGHVPMVEVPARSAQLWHDFLQRLPEAEVGASAQSPTTP